ncbi:MAG: hypothetical protein AAB425_07130 [Bdellovibrionota bacterium]
MIGTNQVNYVSKRLERFSFPALIVFCSILNVACGSKSAGVDTSTINSSTTCPTSFSYSGAISGVTWKWDSLKLLAENRWMLESTEPLTESEKAVMPLLGLDPTSESDLTDYRYFIWGYDYRMMFAETKELWQILTFALADRVKEVMVIFFDVMEYKTEPGTEVSIYDISEFPTLRSNAQSGDLTALAALGSKIRTWIKDIRTNGKPDAIVAFAGDRSQESAVNRLFITLLSDQARFAKSGTAKFLAMTDSTGNLITDLDHTEEGIKKVSKSATSVNALFTDADGGAASYTSTCKELKVLKRGVASE